MNPSGMLLLRARLQIWRWGPALGSALLLCALGAAAWAYALLLQAPAEAASRQALALAQAAAEQAPPPTPAETAAVAAQSLQSGDGARLAAFYASLGERPLASGYLQTFFDLAAQAEVALDQGDYKWAPGADVQRYRIELPVKGSYPALRGFVEQVLLRLPFVALDELSVKRETVGDETISATLAFTLFLRPGSSAADAAPDSVTKTAAEAAAQR
jgi:hypothetical protein